MLLAGDIGNSTISLAVFEQESIIKTLTLSTPVKITREIREKFVKFLQELKVNRIILSSVVPRLDKDLARVCKEVAGIKPQFIDAKTDTGLIIDVDEPEELGADRIVNSVGALRFFQPPVIVIDSGTATTFDIVNRNRTYIGGVIFPGIEISLKSLAENTEKLNKIQFGIPRSIIGRTTAECIRAGLYYSYIGSLNYLITEYRKILSPTTGVIVTGGLVKYLKNKLTGVDLYEEKLIFYGIKEIHDRIFLRK